MQGIDWGTLITAIVGLLTALGAHYRIGSGKGTTPKQ